MKMSHLLALLASTTSLYAEPLRQPEFLKEYAETRGFLLGRPVKPKIAAGRVFFLRSESRSRSQSFYEWKEGQAQLLLRPDDLLKGQDEKLSPEEKARNERKRQLGTGFTDYFPAPSGKSILLPLSGKLFLYDLTKGAHRQLAIQGNTIDPQWAPDSRKIAYVKAQDVWVYNLDTGREQPATTGGTPQITHGIAEFVAQEEMHRLSGYCWSPDSQKIAFEEADHRNVEVWYISDPLHPENPPANQYYPRPGKTNVKARLGIVTLARPQKPEWISLPAEYLGALHWDKRGPLTLQLQDRLQQKLRLVEVDNGKLRTLHQQSSPAWVALHQEVPIWLDQQRYLYLVGRGDRVALAVCDRQNPPRFLEGQQDYDISELVAYVPEKKAVLCRIDSQPGNPRLHWIALEGTAPADPSIEGAQEAVTTKDLTIIHQQSMQHLPRLLQNDQEIEGKGVEPQLPVEVAFESVTVAGLEFKAALIWPQPRQKDLKYPVILDVYGGPTKVQVSHSRRNWLMDQWLANQGFAVVAIDNRGTPGRGRAWETAVYGKFDSLPLDDQVQALTALAGKFPQLDLQRVGIWGWSFGGYLSAQAVLKRPDFFKAAVAGAPVTDWLDYDTHYTERYLGTPQSQPEAYTKSCLIPLAAQLKRPLLLVHGSADDNVYYRHSLKLSDALFRAGQPYELLTLPGITHSFRADVAITERLWARTVAFFKQHLGEPLTPP